MDNWIEKWIDKKGGNVWLLTVGVTTEYCIISDIIRFAKILFF